MEIGALDKDGYTVDNANNRVEIKVTGAGRLVGLDNGDSTDFDQVKTSSRRLFGGKLLAVIAPVEGVTGKITVTAEAEGLWAASIDLCVTDDKNMCDEYLTQSCICTDKIIWQRICQKTVFSFPKTLGSEIIPAMPKG